MKKGECYMSDRIKDKIEEIEEFLDFLIERVPATLEEYKADLEKKAICERYAEKIIEATVDLAFLVIKRLKISLILQTSDSEIFDLLFDKSIISEELSKKLHDAKGMRNILAHEYGKVNDEIVFEAVSSDLENDARKFISAITDAIDKEEKNERDTEND